MVAVWAACVESVGPRPVFSDICPRHQDPAYDHHLDVRRHAGQRSTHNTWRGVHYALDEFDQRQAWRSCSRLAAQPPHPCETYKAQKKCSRVAIIDYDDLPVGVLATLSGGEPPLFTVDSELYVVKMYKTGVCSVSNGGVYPLIMVCATHNGLTDVVRTYTIRFVETLQLSGGVAVALRLDSIGCELLLGGHTQLKNNICNYLITIRLLMRIKLNRIIEDVSGYLVYTAPDRRARTGPVLCEDKRCSHLAAKGPRRHNKTKK
ncbi:hypothetical protein EVAR_41871_1 [Eumeta japonica]|uniref:Uncharacterized protein n=1 Tax=Eumeta variegata TaxID=151549 RepID=A0A4C1XAR5_EUMVA|nr:hypothetical protein EVAR_41871_1 [Eumeta japonica]